MDQVTDDELLEAIGGLAPEPVATGRTVREERIVAGFEEVQRFVATHGRAPTLNPAGDIFERLYAVRLERMRSQEEMRALLGPLDVGGLLEGDGGMPVNPEGMSDEALLAAVGDAPNEFDIRTLRHVRSSEERRAAEEVANRIRCEDFEHFNPLFNDVEEGLRDGRWETRLFGQDAAISKGDFFILGGQTAYVAEMGEAMRAPNGATDARMRVVFSNGTESNLLMRSLQRALYKDEAGRRLVDVTAPTLFSDEWAEGDVSSGTIYVLRSLSEDPQVASHRELIHKIGVTGGSVESRIAGAAKDPTYLLADVELVATYKLASINRTRLERLLQRIFGPAQLDLTIQDRFGTLVKPREWFLVPLAVIDEAVARIVNGTITDMIYDPGTARLIEK